MNSGMMLPIILIIILGIFAIIFLVITKKQAQNGSINKSITVIMVIKMK